MPCTAPLRSLVPPGPNNGNDLREVWGQLPFRMARRPRPLGTRKSSCNRYFLGRVAQQGDRERDRSPGGLPCAIALLASRHGDEVTAPGWVEEGRRALDGAWEE